MNIPSLAVHRIQIEKAALDNGWDVPPSLQSNGWIRCSSSRLRDVVWVGTADGKPLLACSRSLLLAELEQVCAKDPTEGPGVGCVALPDWPQLEGTLRRAAHLSASLPDQIANEFKVLTAHLPRSTEVERLVVQRVGQQLFRTGLLEYWDGRCAVTGLAVPELLRASHIKPWARCDSDEERLDIFNGLLLAPHLDALFDGGWLTFTPIGRAEWSRHVPEQAVADLGLLGVALMIGRLRPEHERYMATHRKVVWKG